MAFKFGLEGSKIHAVVDKTAPLLAGLTTEKAIEMTRGLDISFDELFVWQSKKSEAFAGGKISLADASYLYEMIGEAVTVFNSRPLAVKLVVSQFMCLLLKP